MPAIGNVVINDGASTPVSHTFVPTNIDTNGVANYADQSGGVQSGYSKLTSSLKDAATGSTAGSSVNRVQVSVYLPTVADGSDAGIPAGTLLYFHKMDATFLMPASGTLAERKNLLAFAKNYLADASISAQVQDLTHVY